MNFPFRGIISETLTLNHNQSLAIYGRRSKCADYELNSYECLEAYGFIKGSNVCKQFMDDFKECQKQQLSTIRATIMRNERLKKVVKGELPAEKRWGTPYRHEAYITGTFVP